jgi:S1-C subfamily serine protease
MAGESRSRTVPLQVQREREKKQLVIRMVPEREVFHADLIRQKTGLTLQELTPDLAARTGLAEGSGFLITGVENSSPADAADLRRGYLVQSMDGQSPEDMVRAARIFYRKKAGEKVVLGLIVPQQRGRFVRFFSTTVELTVR